MPTSTLMDMGPFYRIIVDCGLGVTRAIRESGREVQSFTHIFITHYHSDHILELGGLIHTAWASGLNHEVHLYGPPGLDDVWAGFLLMMKFDIDLRIGDEGRVDLRNLVKTHVYGGGGGTQGPTGAAADGRVPVMATEGDLAAGDLRVWAHRNFHPPVTESYALRFEWTPPPASVVVSAEGAPTKSVTFSGDTTYCPALGDFARGSDVLVHEVMHPKGIEWILSKTTNTDDRLKKHLMASHCLAADVGRVAAAANVGHLLLNHLLPPEREICSDQDFVDAVSSGGWAGPILVGFDGASFTL
jgi:ribonuclease BN (tRNA processing enzyme)